MEFIKKQWPSLKDFLFIGLGTLVQAISLRIFLVPANLASGGISGISQIIHHFTGWPIGLMVFLGNLPLLALGWRFLGGGKFATRTAFAVMSYSFFIDAVLWIPFFPAAGLTDDLVINALYGAVVSGVGYGLVYRGQGTSGGSDILARILVYWKSIPVTQSYLMVDSLVILSAGFVFGWKQALYAMITLYVSGIVVDTTMEGGGTIRTALIITAQPKAVADKILQEMDRGVTMMSVTGAFTGEARQILYCVLTRGEVPMLKNIVHSADEKAFMVVGAAHEALGEGFQPFKRD